MGDERTKGWATPATARVNYEAALTLDNGHGKARRRLLALDTTA